jgi:hypothetical protein
MYKTTAFFSMALFIITDISLLAVKLRDKPFFRTLMNSHYIEVTYLPSFVITAQCVRACVHGCMCAS